MYQIEVKNKIIKLINNLPNSQIIWTKLKLLEDFKSEKKLNLDIEKMKGNYKNHYRLRVGNIRIIFGILKNKLLIKSADYRGKVYS